MLFYFVLYGDQRDLHIQTHSFPTRRSSDLDKARRAAATAACTSLADPEAMRASRRPVAGSSDSIHSPASGDRHSPSMNKRQSSGRSTRARPASVRGATKGRSCILCQDRTSVVWGKSVPVRVDLGGRRIIKKKQKHKKKK